MFNIGDTVRVLDHYLVHDNNGNKIKEKIGKVIENNRAFGDVTIDFGYGFKGHDAGGVSKRDTCWYMYNEYLELVNIKKGNYKNYV